MVNPFVVSLDIIVMINILKEMIKILHEKMLKAKMYWFNKCSFQRTSNKWIEVGHISCQIKSPWYEQTDSKVT